jgi:hypothetical protein
MMSGDSDAGPMVQMIFVLFDGSLIASSSLLNAWGYPLAGRERG